MKNLFLHCIIIFILGATVSVARSEELPKKQEQVPDPAASASAPEKSLISDLFEDISFPGRVEGFLDLPIYSFYLGAPSVNGEAYVPNFAPRLGVALGWKELSFSTAISLPLPNSEVERRGQTDQANFFISRYWRNYALNIYYQFHRGFYIASPWSELDRNRPARYPQLPDAEAMHFGFHFTVILKKDSLSLNAAYSQGEIQKQSGGSFLVMPFYNHLQISRGSAFIRGSDSNARTTIPDFKDTHLDTVGAAGGYGYIWVKDLFFITGQVSAGPGIQFQQISDSEGNKNGITNLALNGNVSVAVGRNFPDRAFGLRSILSSLVSSVAGLAFYSTLMDAQIYYCHRF